MKVAFTFKDGRTKTLDQRIAAALTKMSRGTYETTELVGVSRRPVRSRTTRVSLEEPLTTDLGSMDLDALREHARKIGAKHHPFAGPLKVRKAIEDYIAAASAVV